MYLLYLDESGSHPGSTVLVLAGIAIQEQDAWYLQERLHSLLARHLPQGLDPSDFELHANEIKSPIKPGKKIASPWSCIPVKTRFEILRATFSVICEFTGQDPKYPPTLFGAVVDRQYKDREQRAYEEVLNKFDEMLTRQGVREKVHQRGIVIHDRGRAEADVQRWAETWRHVKGRIGKLTHLADVPLFVDSRATRLIQAADFIAWGLYRHYGDAKDEQWIKRAWPRFDNVDGIMHGLIHVNPDYRKGTCPCPPCRSRNIGSP